MAVLSTVNLFARDPEGLVQFYGGLFGLPEIVAQRSPIYRAVDAGSAMIGFNAFDAYGLLGLDAPYGFGGAHSMLTFDIDDPVDVALLADRATRTGATLVKPPYDTAYGSRQAVLRDPEGNVFRINAFYPTEAPE
jgi:predicted enzyme related to lactoylglutathione lyase